MEVYDFHGKTATETRRLLDDNGLKAPSGHWLLPALQKKLEKSIEDTKTIVCEYMVMPIIENLDDRRALDRSDEGIRPSRDAKKVMRPQPVRRGRAKSPQGSWR